jgi:nucleotide-binding universal stress UspA family protein
LLLQVNGFMSYILSTSNTSSKGLQAAEYAAGLAMELSCPLLLAYAYVVPVTFGEVPLPVMPADEAKRIAEEHAVAARKAIEARFPDLYVTTDVAYGDLADVLEEIVQRKTPWLTIIGNDEEPDAEGLIGVYARRMLREAGHPVLAVPHSTVFSVPKHVGIAVDDRCLNEGAALESLAQLRGLLGFRISVLRVLTEDSKPTDFSETKLGKQLSGESVSYVELPPSGAVDQAIAEYAVGPGAMDWIAIVPHHYNFWEGLFHRSHTTHMLHLVHKPILALHGSI